MSEAPAVPAGSRLVGGRLAPEAGTWTVDPVHSTFEFVARHLMAKVRGRFSGVSGTAEIAEAPGESNVTVELDASSIITHDETRDGHLKSGDFFLVQEHPKITFRSTALRPAEEAAWKLDGELTIRGITRPVSFDLEFLGTSADPWGNMRAGFSAATEVNRHDWDLNWNAALESGGFLLGKNVRLEVEVEATRQ